MGQRKNSWESMNVAPPMQQQHQPMQPMQQQQMPQQQQQQQGGAMLDPTQFIEGAAGQQVASMGMAYGQAMLNQHSGAATAVSK